MNTTIATIATVLTLAFGFNASAAEANTTATVAAKTAAANPLKDYNAKKVTLTYVEALTLGNIEYNKYLFTKDFTYENATNDQVASRKQYLDFLKANKGLVYDCTTSYEVLDQTGNCSISKVTMKFDTFSRVDYITIQHSEAGWQVSKVVTTYL